MFSTHRGDTTSTIRGGSPISAVAKSKLKVDQSPASRALETFIHGLVVEEFDGAEPPAAVLDGLAAYVRALHPAACPSVRSEAVTVGSGISDVLRDVAAADAALARRDAATTLVMIQAARAQLGDIAERFNGAALAPERERVATASYALADVGDLVRRGARRRRTDRSTPGWRLHPAGERRY